MTILATPCSIKISYSGDHEINNFGRGLNSLSKYAISFNSVSVKVQKKTFKP